MSAQMVFFVSAGTPLPKEHPDAHFRQPMAMGWFLSRFRGHIGWSQWRKYRWLLASAGVFPQTAWRNRSLEQSKMVRKSRNRPKHGCNRMPEISAEIGRVQRFSSGGLSQK